jgi:hypothetical protein
MKRADSITYIKEKTRNFEREILSNQDNIYLDGYWQSEKYFVDIRTILLNELTLKSKIDDINKRFTNRMLDSQSVSIHIRRGDYVSDQNNYKLFGVLGLDYYNKSIKYMLEKVNNPEFFVFSDDPDWAEKNIKINAPLIFIKHNSLKNYEDIRLMSSCKHHIIANSSFSWWGAWLGSNNDKIVIGPSVYYRGAEYKDSDRMPIDWIRM